MADNAPNDRVEYDDFLVAGPVYLLAPFPRPSDQVALLRGCLRLTSHDREGIAGDCLAVFTDLDLAEKCRSDLVETRSKLKPLTFPDKYAFADALVVLLAIGETHLGIDPGRAMVRRIDIHRVLAGIRSRPR